MGTCACFQTARQYYLLKRHSRLPPDLTKHCSASPLPEHAGPMTACRSTRSLRYDASLLGAWLHAHHDIQTAYGMLGRAKTSIQSPVEALRYTMQQHASIQASGHSSSPARLRACREATVQLLLNCRAPFAVQLWALPPAATCLSSMHWFP